MQLSKVIDQVKRATLKEAQSQTSKQVSKSDQQYLSITACADSAFDVSTVLCFAERVLLCEISSSPNDIIMFVRLTAYVASTSSSPEAQPPGGRGSDLLQVAARHAAVCCIVHTKCVTQSTI
jgi:hypothetical protein